MASNGKKENILTSWKEIAAYLDRDVRTCVRWEKRYGLPVHRLERDSKAKVFAYREQIDEWLAERSALASSPAVCELPARRWFRPFRSFSPWPAWPRRSTSCSSGRPAARAPASPADFRISGSKLIVVDGRGRDLWPFDTRLPDLEGEETYRPRSERKAQGSDYIPVWPYLLIRDIDGDKRPEVLFSTQTASEYGEGRLFCFDEHGTELWRFDAGRALEFGGRPHHREYRSSASTSTITTATARRRSWSSLITSRIGPARSFCSTRPAGSRASTGTPAISWTPPPATSTATARRSSSCPASITSTAAAASPSSRPRIARRLAPARGGFPFARRRRGRAEGLYPLSQDRGPQGPQAGGGSRQLLLDPGRGRTERHDHRHADLFRPRPDARLPQCHPERHIPEPP